MNALRPILAVVALPGVVTVFIPALMLYRTRSFQVGGYLPAPWSLLAVMLGSGLVCTGLLLMYKTVSLFTTVGHGTLAPWDPPRRLVVRGIYRHVRNPMITGVFCILLGEALVFGSLPLFDWFVLFVLANALYIPFLEERSLARRFGAEYERYKQHVPRWIPRLRPWLPDDGQKEER